MNESAALGRARDAHEARAKRPRLVVNCFRLDISSSTDGTSFGEMSSGGWRGFARRSSPKAVSGQPPPESHKLDLSSFGPPPFSGSTIQPVGVSVGKPVRRTSLTAP